MPAEDHYFRGNSLDAYDKANHKIELEKEL